MGIIFVIIASISTFLGGLVALRLRNKMNLLLGFAAGAILSVVAFDLLPEIFEATEGNASALKWAMVAMVSGFIIFHVLEKFILIHHGHEHEYGDHSHPHKGKFSASALILHSFIDGLGIGLAFGVSQDVGIAVALAVIAHDFCDGLNTVSLMLSHNNSKKASFYFLIADALAPLVGGLVGLLVVLPDFLAPLYLGLFAGTLLYIGAADILPEAHSKDSSVKTVLATVLGAVVLFLAIGLLG